jgi:hypothetical protein
MLSDVGDPLLNQPITGIDCCPRANNGDNAALAKNARTPRRLTR